MNRVLIIDDNEQNREILTILFTEEGYAVQAVSGPEKLDEILLNFKPQLLLLDVMLNGYNGLSICYELKTNPLYAFLKIVLLTASHAFQNLDQATVLADAYVTKPFDINELLLLVDSLCSANN